MPVDFLTTEQTESYGRFTGEPDELQLARYFHLDEADKEFIGKSRGDHNRLGIALQIGCVRFLGTFLTDMNHIPSGVRHFTARQLGIRDITVLAEYGYTDALKEIGSANNSKVVMMPLDASSLMGSIAGIAELIKDGGNERKK
ncbi:TPA: DUF4158 domain-containing protein [Enterobacter hormaechei subsp. steigerwaltii]|nr:DUF4158 domain-containing protein [Enterobacter hormaechei subsp. steigerwaltii]